MPVPVLRPEFRPFEPRGGARQLIYCRDPAICYHGPAGTGKTRTVLEKGFLCANLWPNARILLLRKLRADLTESVLATFENEVLPDGHPLKDGANRKTRASYDLTNGSTLVCGGMKNADGSDSRRVMSTEWDLILCFESTEFTYDDFQKLTTRLHRYKRMPFSQIILDCNPAGPKHWLKIEMDAGRITSIPSRHEDNPKWHNGKGWTPDGEVYIGQLDKLTGYNHDRLRKGLWTAAEGVVYDDLDADEREEFELMADRGEFLEHAMVFGNHYGTPRAPVEALLIQGRDVLFDVDWQGARALRAAGCSDAFGAYHEWDEETLVNWPTAGFMNMRMHLDHVFCSDALRWLHFDGSHKFGQKNGTFRGLSDHVPIVGTFTIA